MYPSVKGTTKCLNLLTIDSFCRIEREVKCGNAANLLI
ncbi:hypothetical protein AD18_5000 [Escherichia coli 3-475-03_S4_C2]|nr:hypothetical protein AB17_5073 [Escherichia coli 3-105-05_S1_C1]KDU49136.1 hypothetical protein AD18_5000 [Escherichia coli 3-475-03_S4_C2]KDZ80688.1 hypothetical protein AB75_5115 [Escherichia coli 3-105-05_S1_C3]